MLSFIGRSIENKIQEVMIKLYKTYLVHFRKWRVVLVALLSEEWEGFGGEVY